MSDGSSYTSSKNPGLTSTLKGYAEGTVNSKTHPSTQEQLPTFVRMIVMDVIFDPNADPDDVRKSSWSTMGVSNMNYVDVLPRNTIVAKGVNSNTSPMFVFPFFPSHLSLPCKPGEMVWVMFEKPGASRSDIAYWFCRITEPHHVDDVNHSHPGRHFEVTMFPKSKDRFDSEQEGTAETGDNIWHELRNGPVVRIDDDRSTATSNLILREETADVFERLITNTDAAKLMVYESIPRYRKRPGDIVLEGSNNSLIVLGTDRVGPVAEYEDPTEDIDVLTHTKLPKRPLSDFHQESGMIDIVVGRGQTDDTSGTAVDTTSINDAAPGTKGTPLKKEINKSRDHIKTTEGDPDLRNDRSRILVSQRTAVDTNLGLTSYNNDFGLTENDAGEPAIVIKTDKVRMVARSDIEILVTNYETQSIVDKQDIKNESSDPMKWASIVIKTSGDIIMKPSDKGYILLGSEKADKAILCTDQSAVKSDGKVSPGLPNAISNTNASFVGTGASGQGTWAKKVLVD